MSGKGLKLALAASVALNIFALAGGATAWVLARNVERTAAESRRPARSEPVWTLLDSRPAAVRDLVKREFRAAALEARPDFEEARLARRRAIDLTASDAFDPVAVAALLERSRASEMRGRARLEAEAVETLAQLEPDDRKALAGVLSRRRSKPGDSERPAAAPTPAP